MNSELRPDPIVSGTLRLCVSFMNAAFRATLASTGRKHFSRRLLSMTDLPNLISALPQWASVLPAARPGLFFFKRNDSRNMIPVATPSNQKVSM